MLKKYENEGFHELTITSFSIVLIDFVQLLDESAFVDFQIHCVLTVGEGLDPPVYAVRFRRNAENIAAFPAGRVKTLPYSVF